MVAIKDMEMPKNCKECFAYKEYIAIAGDKTRWCQLTSEEVEQRLERLSDCPLVDIEPLSDEEKRIFLSAMGKERVICKHIDIDKVDDGSIKKLVPIVNTIECKVKKVLWN